MSPINIECELRSFVTEEQFNELFERFKRIAMYGGEDHQITYYFSGNGDPDLRIQKSDRDSKIWMKKGRLHDEAREEIEVHCQPGDFEKLERLFTALGYEVVIKWYRTRHVFKLDGVAVTLDDTKGYGRIIELEKVCYEHERDRTLEELRAKMNEIGVPITPREEFDAKYAWYKEHWRELV